MASSCTTPISYWQEVKLVYEDGFTLEVVLDPQVVQQLQEPGKGETIMAEIRKNAEAAKMVNEVDCSVPPSTTTTVSGTSVVATQEMCSSESSETEDNTTASTTPSYTSWSNDAILYLISCYKEVESDMENPKIKKKDTWQKITKKMNDKGYPFDQNRVESKWRSLLLSHKGIRDNKNKTGSKRKTFRYFDEIEEIVHKRHDICPPVLLGSGSMEKTKTFSTKPEDSTDENDAEISISAKRRRKNGASSNTQNETLNFLRELEEQRKKERKEREENRERRAREKNMLLQQFLEVFKQNKN